MANHRYWRIYVKSVNGSSIVGMKEVEMRATAGGADQTGAGTPLSGGDFSGTFAKANAFDNGAAEWASNTIPGWIGYDFGVNVDVRQISITIRSTDPANDVLQSPRRFTLDYSDDAITWTTLSEEFNVTTWTDGGTMLFEAALALESTKAVTYAPVGPPLLLGATKAVMYVVTGPARQTFKARLYKSIPMGLNA